MNQLFTQNLVKNIELIIKFYKKQKNEIPSMEIKDQLLEIKDQLLDVNYDKTKIVLIKDRSGLYFNAIPLYNYDYQLFNLLYDPENNWIFWTTPEGQLGLNSEIYTNNLTDQSKFYVPAKILSYTQIIPDGTQELFKNDTMVITKIDSYPFNGGNGFYGNMVLYNFYYDPIAFQSCINELPKIIQSIYNYLLKQSEIVDLKQINPNIANYDLEDQLDENLIKIQLDKTVYQLQKKSHNIIPLLEPVVADQKYIEILDKKSLKAWKWINNGCWLDNLLFAMFAPFPYLPILEEHMLNINLNETLKNIGYYQQEKNIHYPKKYPYQVCSSNNKESIEILKRVQKALRFDIHRLRSNQFDVCVNLRETIQECKKIIHSKNYMGNTFRDPLEDLFYPLIRIFGLENMITFEKTACYYKYGQEKPVIENILERLPAIELDATNTELVGKNNAHLEHLLNQFKIKIITEKMESTINIKQKTIYVTLEDAQLLTIIIRRVKGEWNPMSEKVIHTPVFLPVEIPEILIIDKKIFRLRSIVIRMFDHPHFNSIVGFQTPSHKTSKQSWIYYRNTPGLTQSNNVDAQFFDTYEDLLKSDGDYVRKGAYILFYEFMDQLSKSSQLIDIKHEFDQKCNLLPNIQIGGDPHNPPLSKLCLN